MSKNSRQIAEAVCGAGIKKSQRDTSRTIILGILAGAYIGFGAQIATVASMDAAQYIGVGLSKIVTGTVFSVGLMLVIFGGAELFTGNNLIYLACFWDKVKVRDVVKNWVLVYFGNFIGSMLLAYIIFNTGLYSMGANALGIKALGIANAKVNLTFSEAFFRGIACNWLVCLAVWLATSAEETSGKILACIFPIMVFVASGFEHSIANMYFIPMGIMLKEVPAIVSQLGQDLIFLNWDSFVVHNLIPVTLGNIIGGAVFVAAVYGFVYMKED